VKIINKKKIAIVSGVLIAVFLSQSVFAADVLTPLVEQYKGATNGWFNVLQGYAKRLFWLLATMDFALAVSFLWVKSELSEITVTLIKKIMAIGFFYSLVLYADTWIPAIIDSFTIAGAKASGLANGLSPSKVVDLGVNLSTSLLDSAKKMSLFDSPIAILLSGLCALVILICFVLVAVQLTVALIESYIIIGAGILFLGFGGSQWTRNYSEKYVTYAASVGIKLFIIQLIIGVGLTQAESWMDLVTASQDKMDLVNIFYTLAGALMFFFISMKIPELASSALSGTPQLGGADMIATGMSAANGAVAGAKIAMNGLGVASHGVTSVMSAGVKAASGLSKLGGRGTGVSGASAQSGYPFSNMKNAQHALSSNVGKLDSSSVKKLAAKKAALPNKP
jgi:type IV secretion system protein TrbL